MSWRRVAPLGLAIAAGLAVIAMAGGFNVAASSGHLPGVTALFAWTMHNSVAWRAGADAPVEPLQPTTSGAGHYHLVCRNCHGSPGRPVPASMRNMLPPPPHAREAVVGWQSRELFWIVKHGIKMTAMPAWPSPQRDDEVWQVVAFMEQLPRLDEQAYQHAVTGSLSESERDALDPAVRPCTRCHGADGTAGDDAVPIIAGLGRGYLRQALLAYRRGMRHSGFMQAQVSELTPAELFTAADHFANRTSPVDAPVPARRTRAAAQTLGDRIVRDGVPSRRIPPCAPCHGPGAGSRADEYPSLAGQRTGYLETQLRLFRAGRRGGGAFAPLMHFAARNLSDADIDAVAGYYGSLSSEGTR